MSAAELEEDIRRALAPAVTHRVKPGHDAAAVVREAAGAAVFALSRSGALEILPLPPALVPDGPVIHDGREIDAWFKPGDPNTYARDKPPRVVAIHWTGGSLKAPARRVAKTLTSRRLSIGYVVEGDGDIWQMADDMTQCAHIGSKGNPQSIGIECTHPGFDKGTARVDFLGGRYRMAAWPEEQLAGLVALVQHLCDKWDIPRVLAPESRDLPRDFEGVVGHFNWHESRLDPGPIPFAALAAAGFERA